MATTTYKSQDPNFTAQQSAKLAAYKASLKDPANTSAAAKASQTSAANAAKIQGSSTYQNALASGKTASQASVAYSQSLPKTVSNTNLLTSPAAAYANAASGNKNPYSISTPGVVDQRYTIGSGGAILDARGQKISDIDRERLGRTLGWIEHKTYDANGNVIATNMVPNVTGAKINTSPNQKGGTMILDARSGNVTTGQSAMTGAGAYADARRVAQQILSGQTAPTSSGGGKEAWNANVPVGQTAPTTPVTGGVNWFGNTPLYTGDSKVTDMNVPMPAGAQGVRNQSLLEQYGAKLEDYVPAAQAASPYAGMETEETARARAEAEFYKQQEEEAQRYLDEMTTKHNDNINTQMGQWEQSAKAAYTDKLNEVDKNTKATTEELMRFKGATGSARSSRTMDSMLEIQNKGARIKDQLLEEKERERALYEAQLRGASSEELAGYAKALQDVRAKRQGAEAVLFTAQQGLLLEQQALAMEQEAARKEEYVNYLKQIGMAVDPITGEKVETLEGQIDRSTVEKNLAAAQKTKLEAEKLQKALDNNWEVEIGYDGQGNQIYQWYDPTKPGEIQTFQSGVTKPVASSGGGGGGGGGGYSGGGSGSGSAATDFLAKLGQEMALGGDDWQTAVDKTGDMAIGTGDRAAILEAYYNTKAGIQMPAPANVPYLSGGGNVLGLMKGQAATGGGDWTEGRLNTMPSYVFTEGKPGGDGGNWLSNTWNWIKG